MIGKSLKELKIGIVGVGIVGRALRNYFEKKGDKPFLYDKGKNIGSIEEINKADIIFVCVSTPYDKEKGFDFSFVKETCQNLKGNKIVVIKSTVIPGTTEKLQKECPQHKFLFNPEFLTERLADQNMQNPDRQIIGYTEKSKDIAEKIMSLLPEAPFHKTILSTEAEMLKYFGNTFLAVKVIFGNQMYDLCQKLNIDYEQVRECASADKRIGPSHLDIHYEEYRGYGGKCLPKDIKSLIEFADKQGINLKLHKITEEINQELMDKQNIEDPEKFSKRE